jgi:hypothetical protein
VSPALTDAVAAGVGFLESTQATSGEFESYATPLGVEVDWAADSSVFVTSLSVLALERVPDPRVGPMVERALDLVASETAPGPLWRFWTHDHDRHREIPCDADDTACATMALGRRAADAARTKRLLLANRDPGGRFLTWFLPRGAASLSPARLRNTVDEWRARSRREMFWEMTEATPDDVDGVVNANVLRLFGPDAPAESVAYVSGVVIDGRERECDSWHRNEFSCWYSVADGARRGVPYEGAVLDRLARRLRDRLEDGPAPTSLDLAHALGAAQAIGDPSGVSGELVERLVAVQSPDGSWDRDIFFYGGPKEVFAWGSEAFTTAAAVSALADAAASGPVA